MIRFKAQPEVELPKIDPARVPLVVIDMINSSCSKKFERPEWELTTQGVRDIVPRLNAVMHLWRAAGGRVILVKTVPWTRVLLPENIRDMYDQNSDARFYTEHDIEESAMLWSELEVTRGDPVVMKNSYSAFHGSAGVHMKQMLKEWDTRRFAVAGAFSDGCVDATVVHAFSLDYEVVVLGDLVAPYDSRRAQHDDLVTRKWPHMYGHVVNTVLPGE